MTKYIKNQLKCLKCNDILEAPNNDREIATCRCRNRAWIQKRPNVLFWAYGSVDPMAHERIRISHEKSIQG